MKLGYTFVAWITFMGCFGQLVANQCANFTDLKHSTVAERTVSLSFRIVNACPMTSVQMFTASIWKPQNPPYTTICQAFVTPGGSCSATPGCTCDDKGTFGVTRQLEQVGKPDSWYLTGELSNGERFSTNYQVWAENITIPTFTTLSPNSTSSAAKNSTKNPDGPHPTNTSSEVHVEGTTGENKTGVTSPTFGDAFAKFADSNEFIYVILGSIGGVVLLIVVFTAILCHVLCRMKKNESNARAPMRKFRSRVARGARRTVDSVAMVFNLPWQKEQRDDDY